MVDARVTTSGTRLVWPSQLEPVKFRKSRRPVRLNYFIPIQAQPWSEVCGAHALGSLTHLLSVW